MSSIFICGFIFSAGFIMGELAERIRLPKVTGYIIAGILLNPELFHFIPKDFVNHTELITNISLSFITFSIGGTLFYPEIKRLGKGIVSVTLWEAETTFLIVILGFLATLPFLTHIPHATWFATFIPLSLVIGAIASPTDPTSTLAIVHEHNAKGDVSSTMLSVSAFDDALGLMNYSIAVALGEVFILHQGFNIYTSAVKPIIIILSSIAIGIAFGFILNFLVKISRIRAGGTFVVILLGLLSFCFGVAHYFKLDELLSTMVMGIVVVNFSEQREKIFEILKRNTEEIVFVLFFTLSGMFLDFSIFAKVALIVLAYAIFRTTGKFAGTWIGATLTHSSPKIRKYTALGLIPSGGMIVGLALMLKQDPAYHEIADIVISVIIGATVVHELIGPIFTKFALKRVGEIRDE